MLIGARADSTTLHFSIAVCVVVLAVVFLIKAKDMHSRIIAGYRDTQLHTKQKLRKSCDVLLLTAR
jgi:hypothetical protein